MHKLIYFFIFFFGILYQELSSELSSNLFTLEEWEEIAPHLLPDTHPVKPALDEIFVSERVIRNQDSMKNAGFKIITKGHWSDTVIAIHPKVSGFYFKLFTEDQAHINEISRLLARINGAIYAQRLVDQHGWNKMFKVPRKWLYVLPEDPSPVDGIPTKRIVLIAEDMRLLSRTDSYRKWKQKDFNKKLFKAVFELLTEGGFSDSAYAFNLPFAKDGRIALIDNDKFNKRPIPFSKLLRYLHPKIQKYGQKLIDDAGPAVAY